MKLEFALVGVLLAGCSEPTLPTGKSITPGVDASAEAGSGAMNGTERGGRSKPVPTDGKGGDDDVEQDAGAEGRAQASEHEVTPDAGQDASTGETGSAGLAGAGGGTATAMPTMGDLVGAWSGELKDLLDRSYSACVHVTQVGTQGPAGDSYYTGALNCIARLTYLETVDGVHSFDEVTRPGTACPRGILTLAVTRSDTATYNWYLNQGSIPEAIGTLTRTDSCP